MPRSTRRLAVGFLAWTAFVWGNRVLNAVRNDEGFGGLVLSVIVGIAAIAFIVGLATAWRGDRVDRATEAQLRALSLVTVIIWAVRGVDIASSDHGAGFIVVHLVLAAVSIALSVAVWRALPTAAWSPAEVSR